MVNTAINLCKELTANDYSLSLGIEGKKAVKLLIDRSSVNYENIFV